MSTIERLLLNVCYFSVSSVIFLSDINLSTLATSVTGEINLMSREEILETAKTLCSLLQHEFIFVPVS